MTTLDRLRPFKQGNAHEVEQGMVRIYDAHGFPRVEVWQCGVADDGLDDIASDVVNALNKWRP